MFVCVARLTLDVPDSGSLKAKRQVLRRITDRVKARFNASVAEVDDNDLWQRAVLGLAVIGNDSRFVQEQIDKIIQFVDDLYVAPVSARETEVIPLGDALYGRAGGLSMPVQNGQRSLAEAEGLGDWEHRHETKSTRSEGKGKADRKLTLDEARKRARSLRNPREWEKP